MDGQEEPPGGRLPRPSAGRGGGGRGAKRWLQASSVQLEVRGLTPTAVTFGKLTEYA